MNELDHMYVKIGISVIDLAWRNVCKVSENKQVNKVRDTEQEREDAFKWLSGYDSNEELSFGWYLFMLKSFGIPYPNEKRIREQLVLLQDPENRKAVWRRMKEYNKCSTGSKDTKN